MLQNDERATMIMTVFLHVKNNHGSKKQTHVTKNTVQDVCIIVNKFHCGHFVFVLLLQIANIGPADYNFDESISTLRYANRAKNIKNKAKINEDPKDALLRQFQKEIEELRKQLQDGRT